MNNIYEEEAKKRIKNNMKDALKNTKEYQKKLEKYAEKFELEIEFLQQIVLEDIFLINQILKSPTKQNYQENTAKKYILQNYPEFKDFKILPKNSTKSLYIANGLIIDKNNLSTNNHTKSIDFQWKYLKFNIYATHKYTKESGGAQDNQYKDIISFLEHAKQHTKGENLFVAICDGEYYLKNNRLNDLKTKVLNTNCVVCTIETLKKELDDLINKKKRV